ncbi:MAG: rRNA pseudouridine synthase [Lachnospiraceae bacterium]|nr:rRNA pseudouridine synthase [Lachnospiraceae bacterium]
MRLDKYLTQAGVGTRSEVKEYIRKGCVCVDGIVEKHADRKVDEAASEVTFQGTRVRFQKFVYYMLNKPAGFVSATQDSHDKTVVWLLRAEGRTDLFPVGRLDKDTEGLLLLTNDGDMAHRLLSPRRHVPKQYFVRLAEDLSEETVRRLEAGVDIGEKKPTLPSVFEWKNRQAHEAYLTITEGKFHQVKRMFAAVGNKVLFLRRVRMGNLVLDEGLPPGEYRPLYEDEIKGLLDVTE